MALEGRWLFTELVISPPEAGGQLLGFRFRSFGRPYAERVQLDLAGKSLSHFWFLALVLAVPVFILGVLWIWARTPIPRRPKLWGLFIAFGASSLQLNWDTGALHFDMFYAFLLGAGVTIQPGTGFWVMQFGIPVGAIAFMLRRREWLSQEGQEVQEVGEGGPSQDDG